MSLPNYNPKHKKAPWLTAFPPKQKPAAAPKRIRSRTKERAKEDRKYSKQARFFIRSRMFIETCPVIKLVPTLDRGPRASGYAIGSTLCDVHHAFGRMGDLLLWEEGWVAVSRTGHKWIHENLNEARALGLLCQAGDWNRRPAELEEKAKELKRLLATNLAKRI